MDTLSDKAKIVYAVFKALDAEGEKNAITSYTILDYIEENEDLQESELLKDIGEAEFVEIIMDMNIKSINTLVASMCRKDLIGKTEPVSMKVDGERRYLRKYFLK